MARLTAGFRGLRGPRAVRLALAVVLPALLWLAAASSAVVVPASR